VIIEMDPQAMARWMNFPTEEEMATREWQFCKVLWDVKYLQSRELLDEVAARVAERLGRP
jgi:hypothetical protein